MLSSALPFFIFYLIYAEFILGCIFFCPGPVLGAFGNQGSPKYHHKSMWQFTSKKVIKRSWKGTMRLKAARCLGRDEGEGLVRSITEDFGDIIWHASTHKGVGGLYNVRSFVCVAAVQCSFFSSIFLQAVNGSFATRISRTLQRCGFLCWANPWALQ